MVDTRRGNGARTLPPFAIASSNATVNGRLNPAVASEFRSKCACPRVAGYYRAVPCQHDRLAAQVLWQFLLCGDDLLHRGTTAL